MIILNHGFILSANFLTFGLVIANVVFGYTNEILFALCAIRVNHGFAFGAVFFFQKFLSALSFHLFLNDNGWSTSFNSMSFFLSFFLLYHAFFFYLSVFLSVFQIYFEMRLDVKTHESFTECWLIMRWKGVPSQRYTS